MAARTTTRILFAAVIVAAGTYFAPKLLDQLGSTISDVTGANNAVTIGEGDTAIMVTPEHRPKLAACAPEQIIQTKQCDGLRILTVDAMRMPFIARNTKLAWESDRKGSWAREPVSGRILQNQYPPKDGDRFLVVIIHPEQIAPGPFTGTDIAKEQGLC